MTGTRMRDASIRACGRSDRERQVGAGAGDRRALGGEIVNTDSMQVYRDLSIVTARPDGGDLGRAPHHLYGHVDGAENHSVGRWREEALRASPTIAGRGRLPIFVGGTGLYFKAVESGLAAMPQVPEAVREAVRAAAEALPTPDLHARLAAQGRRNGRRLRPSDRQRILRALEVIEATGTPLSTWQAAPHCPRWSIPRGACGFSSHRRGPRSMPGSTHGSAP